ncbi:MAG: TIR domain-containing protein [candidate division Zixibacteria bacterium]|nr:TIR domain-containing protein [candidate division Zixibacteria bacterium]MDH3938067.1 TIR domain-containing protein [candidate division Zixibacteria bacterium]MDH4034560.1 TIR domain-containing protein [candidate division Zixibacteria bacterium]
MADGFKYDVFLSYNSKDKPRVLRLATQLKKAGLRVWFDKWVVKPGDDIYLAIERGIETTRTLLLCMTPNALASDWVALERSSAIHRDPANEGRRFIPLLLADCKLPDTLRRYKYVDFREESDEEAAFAELLSVCQPDAVDAPLMAKPAPKKKILKKKPPPKKPRPKTPPEETEPLAVLERKLTGHKGWVWSVAVSPDGTWAASGLLDSTVQIWDMETSECRATLKGHTDHVNSVAITPDGKRILSGSADHSVRVWNASSGRRLAMLKGHTHHVRSVVALQDNARALSGGSDNMLRLWDLSSRSCLKTIDCGPNGGDNIFTCAVNRAGTHALSGHRDGRIRHWDLEAGECLATLKGHSSIVKSVQIMPDGRFAVSGSDDKTVKVWDLEAGSCVGTLEGHQNKVHSVAIPPDFSLIASTGFQDKTVRLWDWKSGASLQVIEYELAVSPISVTFSPDGSRLVVGTALGPIYVYRLTDVRAAPPAEATRRYVNAKVVLIGESTVGKTTLAHRLVKDRYVKTDSTHGMNVWRLDLPPATDETDEREALLWDFAGQLSYREIHQLYLDQTALALLLINPQKDDPFAEAGDWIKALESAAAQHDTNPEVPKVLITTRSDVGGVMVSERKIKRFLQEYDFKAWLSTGAKKGENCSDKKNGGQPSKLKQLIAENIPWDKLEWTSTPRLLAELKKAVMAMRDESDIRLLRFAELAQRLEQALPVEKFGASDVRTAVTLLANHGLARPLKFGDLVLLQPELINGYAGAIIRAARAHTDEIGCVPEADIYQPGFDFTGVERLKNRPDEELLLRALVQTFLDHSLCIAEETPQGRHLVFPSQYRREKDIPHEPDIFVSYTFSGEWQTVWTTLVVRLWYSNEFEHRELWRNAAEFAFSDLTLGLKIGNQPGEGTGTISLYFDKEVPDELRVIFIEYVHRHLAKYGCEVTRDRRYVCQDCGKPVKDLDAVRRRMERKKDFITCQECDEQVPFIDFIEQRLKSDPVARKILAMDETATRQLDTQALEQILIGHMMAIAGDANQIFRPVTMFEYGIDGEVEFRDNDGKASGKKICVQLKSGDSYLRTRKADGNEVFDVKNDRHLEYWLSLPVDVYLVIRQTDGTTDGQVIRWMNVTRYLKARKDKKNRQIVFQGVKLDMEAVWKVRDEFFGQASSKKRKR